MSIALVVLLDCKRYTRAYILEGQPGSQRDEEHSHIFASRRASAWATRRPSSPITMSSDNKKQEKGKVAHEHVHTMIQSVPLRLYFGGRCTHP